MGMSKIKKDRGLLMSLAIGVLISFMVLMVLSAAGGMTVYMMDDPLAVIDISSLICLLVSGLVSSFIISKITNKGKSLVSILCALLFSLLMLGIGAIWGAGSLSLRVVLNYVCYIGIAVIGTWLATREKKRKRR